MLKKFLTAILLIGCLLTAGTVLAANENRLAIPEGVKSYERIGEHAIMIYELEPDTAWLEVPGNDAEFYTLAGYAVSNVNNYLDFFDNCLSVKNGYQPNATAPLMPTPTKPAFYAKVPMQLQHSPMPWWSVELKAGTNHKDEMIYVDQKGNILEQPLKKSGLVFARPTLQMKEGKFIPAGALDYVGLVPQGMSERVRISDDGNTVEVMPSYTVSVGMIPPNNVDIYLLDGKGGKVKEQFGLTGKLIAGEWYRIVDKN